MNSTMIKYILQGLCPYCGKEKGEYYCCEDCRKMKNESLNRRRAERRAQGICPRCGKNELWGDERQCLECTAKGYAIAMRRDREHYNKVHREWDKRVNAELREKGICTRCKKRPATAGHTSCSICRARGREYYRKKRSHKRPEGICIWCDKPVKEGMKVCIDHWADNIRRANSPRAKEMRKVTRNLW